MRKQSPDVNISETCIDANLKMVERRDPDIFPRFPPQEWCAWTIPEIALKEMKRNPQIINRIVRHILLLITLKSHAFLTVIGR